MADAVSLFLANSNAVEPLLLVKFGSIPCSNNNLAISA